MKKFKGFTLIEILVVVSIMLLFIGGALAQYNTFTEQTKLKNAAKKLIDVLELAKKKALSSDLQDKSRIDDFTGYQVNLAANDYSLIFCLDDDCSVPPGINVNTYAFNNANITITTPASPTDLNFPPLMSDVDFSAVPSIRLKNDLIDKCVDISVSSIGIFELDETLDGC